MTPLAVTAAAVLLAAVAGDPKARADAAVAAFLRGKSNVGLVVGVWAGGQPAVWGYGTVSTRTGDRTPDADTLFEIGSITKAFTGVLLAEAVRRGEVRADDPAVRHLPADLAPPAADPPITLEHLATHSSGLPVEPPLVGAFARDHANPYADFDRARLAANLPKLRLGGKPGERYAYSNLGAGLLGHALAHAAGADSFDALVTARVCRPLGLRDTGEALTGARRARLAQPRTARGEPTPPWDFATLEACGGLRSTAADLLRFAAANLGAVPSDLLPAMRDSHRPRRAGGSDRVRIGLGWHVMPLKSGRSCVWHNGGTYGSRGMLALVPETGTAVVVLCAGDHTVDALALGLLNGMQPRPAVNRPIRPGPGGR